MTIHVDALPFEPMKEDGGYNGGACPILMSKFVFDTPGMMIHDVFLDPVVSKRVDGLCSPF